MSGSLVTEVVRLEDLSADPANARLHSEHNLEAIKGSLQRFGQQKPIVVDSDGIVRAGNGTLEAARSLGWEELTVVRTSLTGTEAMAYSIADNRAGELATWDEDILCQVLALIAPEGENLEGVGFSAQDMEAMFGTSTGWSEGGTTAPDTDPLEELHESDPDHQRVIAVMFSAYEIAGIDDLCLRLDRKEELGRQDAIMHLIALSDTRSQDRGKGEGMAGLPRG